MRFVRFAGLALLTLAPLAFAQTAHAEPTSWLAVGGGYSFQRNRVEGYDARATALGVSVGVGTTAKNPIVVGGIVRSMTYFTLGTDVSLSLRFATRGFARGDWGLAFDAGVVGRWWRGQNYGHFPVQLVLTGGIPYGFNVAVGGEIGDVSGDSPTARGAFALLELDLLRLTVMRSGGTASFWPNPSAVDASHE